MPNSFIISAYSLTVLSILFAALCAVSAISSSILVTNAAHVATVIAPSWKMADIISHIMEAILNIIFFAFIGHVFFIPALP